MKSELKTKWVNALRSDEYKQGRSRLVQGKGDHQAFCCLGVLCEVAGFDRVKPVDANAAEMYVNYVNPYARQGEYDKLTTSLDDDALKGLGMTADQQETLVTMNDLQNRNFNEIADWVEENL